MNTTHTNKSFSFSDELNLTNSEKEMYSELFTQYRDEVDTDWAFCPDNLVIESREGIIINIIKPELILDVA